MKIEDKTAYWRYVQAHWLKNAGFVLETIRHLIATSNGAITIEALVEDGFFEERPWYPAALLAEMLWDSDTDLNEYLGNASLISGVSFA